METRSPMQEYAMQLIQPVKIHGFDFPSTTEKTGVSIIPLCVRLLPFQKLH